MGNMPKPDIEVDAALAARLVDDQFDDLAHLAVGAITEGWDNVVVRLGDDLALRVPRRKEAVQLVLNEQRCLPGIAERVSVPIPAPVRIGKPTGFYPWPWSIVPWFGGEGLTALAVEDRAPIAREVAAFLGELHTEAPADAPESPVRGVPLANRHAVVSERLAAGSIPRSRELLPLWERLWRTEPWTGRPVWLHGDVHPGNLLVENGRLSAVIDFGDVTSGDPASDLAVAWLAFDEAGRQAFYDGLPARYQADEPLLMRTTAWGVSFATVFATYSDDNPAMAAIGVHAIDELLEWDQSSGSMLK